MYEWLLIWRVTHSILHTIHRRCCRKSGSKATKKRKSSHFHRREIHKRLARTSFCLFYRVFPSVSPHLLAALIHRRWWKWRIGTFWVSTQPESQSVKIKIIVESPSTSAQRIKINELSEWARMRTSWLFMSRKILIFMLQIDGWVSMLFLQSQ